MKTQNDPLDDLLADISVPDAALPNLFPYCIGEVTVVHWHGILKYIGSIPRRKIYCFGVDEILDLVFQCFAILGSLAGCP